jgi:hypothetical protein
MIRRLFWMIAGALLGVTGYRRVSRLARAVAVGRRRGEARGRPRGRDLPRGNRAHGDRTHRYGARTVALFARDVRDGMELYTDRHPRLAGRTLGGQQARSERLHQDGAGGDPGRVYPGVDYAKDGR